MNSVVRQQWGAMEAEAQARRDGVSPFVVAGVRLRPLSLWHAAQADFLEELEGPGEVMGAALARRVLLYSTPVGGNWSLRVSSWWRGWLVARRLRSDADFLAAVEGLDRYLDFYDQRPDLWEDDPEEDADARGSRSRKAEGLRSPWWLAMWAELVQLGVPRDDAWEVTPGWALQALLAAREARGLKVGIVTAKERASMEALDAKLGI